jgi:hypothetical protein
MRTLSAGFSLWKILRTVSMVVAVGGGWWVVEGWMVFFGRVESGCEDGVRLYGLIFQFLLFSFFLP